MRATLYMIPEYDATRADGTTVRVRTAIGLDVGDLDPAEATRLLDALRRFTVEQGLSPLRESLSADAAESAP